MLNLFYKHFLFLFAFSVIVMAITGCIEQGMRQAPIGRQISPLFNETNVTPQITECMDDSPPIVNSEYITLSNFNMNDQGKEVTIKPGTMINASINYDYHCPDCKENLGNQIIIGLAKRSAQACIYNGRSDGQGIANFVLKAPAKPGKYEVRFRAVQTLDCNEALKAPWNADNSPTKETTIGMIVASKKAITIERMETDEKP